MALISRGKIDENPDHLRFELRISRKPKISVCVEFLWRGTFSPPLSPDYPAFDAAERPRHTAAIRAIIAPFFAFLDQFLSKPFTDLRGRLFCTTVPDPQNGKSNECFHDVTSILDRTNNAVIPGAS
jgi:hypothetical protein